MRNRAISLLLAAMMVISLLPTVAFAAESGPKLVPDFNKDGKIDGVDVEQLSSGAIFTIWPNDDDDDAVERAGTIGGNKDCEDGYVNGLNDLLDFFPVLVDVSEVNNWDKLTWKIKASAEDYVNVVYTKLYAEDVDNFEGAKALDGETSLYEADVKKLDSEYQLPVNFLSEGKGILLIEGCKLGEGNIVLTGYKNAEVAASFTLPIKVADLVALPENAKWLGKSGDNHIWYKLEESNTKLTIGGKGAMPDLNPTSLPWKSLTEGITSLVIKSDVTSLSNLFVGCNNLTTVIFKGTTPPTLTSGAILDSVTSIFVPNDAVQTYKNAEGWSAYTGMIQESYSVNHVAFLQRFPWDGKVDISYKVTAVDADTLSATFDIYSGSAVIATTTASIAVESGTKDYNFVWDGDAETSLESNFKSNDITVKVTVQGSSVTSSAGALDLTKNDFVATDEVAIVVDPAWTGGNLATVSIEGEDYSRTYSALTIDTWDTTSLEPGKYSMKYDQYPTTEAPATVNFWVTGAGWEVIQEDITADKTFEKDKTYLVLGAIDASYPNLTVQDGAKFYYGMGAGFKKVGGNLAELPKRYEKSITGDVLQIVETTPGTKDNPWDIGTSGSAVTAYVSGKALYIDGTGQIGGFRDLQGFSSLAADIESIIVSSSAVTGAEANAFIDYVGKSLSLPDGWQGKLPDEDGRWYGGTEINLTKVPTAVRNITFQQRYPWNGMVDITTEISGVGEQNISISAFKKVSGSWEQISVSAIQGPTEKDLGDGGNVLLKLIWNAAEDLKNEELNTIKVEVTLGGKVSGSSIEGKVNLRKEVALSEGATTVAGVTWSDTAWTGSGNANVSIGWKKAGTSDVGSLAEGLTGNGVGEFYLPKRDGAYTLTHSTGSLESFVTYTVSGYPVYTITDGTAADAKGSISIDKTSATASETVTVTVNPDSNYMLKGLTVSETGDEGTTISAVKQQDGTYQFEMPAYAVTVTAEFEAIPAPTYSGGDESTTSIPANHGYDSVKLKATVSGSNATLKEITDEDLEKLLDGENSDTVVLDFSGLSKNVKSVTIPKKSLEKIEAEMQKEDGKVEGLTINTPNGTILLPSDTVTELLKQAEGSTIKFAIESIRESKLTKDQKEAINKFDKATLFDIYIESNGKRICTTDLGGFGGEVALMLLPYEMQKGQNKHNCKVFYIAEDGSLENIPALYNEDGQDFILELEHLSVYAVLYSENAPETCAKDSNCPLHEFSDTNINAWYHDGVHYSIANGIMKGVGENLFKPTATISRAEIVTMLWRLAGEPYVNYYMQFKDVKEGEWYSEAVRFAAAEKIVEGYEDGSFMPNKVMTREEVATVLCRFAKYIGQDIDKATEDVNTLSYNDIFDVSEWAKEGIHYCLAVDVIEGYEDECIKPQNSLTRAEAATMIYRFCEKVLNK